MKKIIFIIISIVLVFSIAKVNISNADFMEDSLNLNTWLEELNLNKYKLENPNLKNYIHQNQYRILSKINNKLKTAIISQYEKQELWYYQTSWVITNYNYFIYYSNKYFTSLKNKEIYWSSKEIENQIYRNLQNMISYYKKFQYIIQKKDSN